MLNQAPSSDQQRSNEPTVNEQPKSRYLVTTSPPHTMDHDSPPPSHNETAPEASEATAVASDNTGFGENLDQPRAENNQQDLGARVRPLIDLSRSIIEELLGMLLMLVIGPRLAISNEQLAEVGFTPTTTSSNSADVLYMRHHEHQDRGSGADSSVSGPYTREEAVSEVRASLLGRIR